MTAFIWFLYVYFYKTTARGGYVVWHNKGTFELVQLTLDSGRELILLAISGENLDAMGRVLEGLQEMRGEA